MFAIESVGSSTPIPTIETRLAPIVSVIRMFMRDFPELNRLIKGEETSDRMIQWAVLDCIDDWNSAPPWITHITLERLPPLSNLRDGIVATLLESMVILQNRNQISFNDGGVSVSTRPETLNLQLAQLFRQRYEVKRDRYKAAQNVESIMDGSGFASEYSIINGAYIGWW